MNNSKDAFNLNNFCITDNIYGNSNIMLPLYITDKHWKLTKTIWNYHISLINNCLESQYNKKMDNIYFYVLLKYYNNLLKNKNIGFQHVKLLFYIIRTCMQICIDNKYCLKIQNEYNHYLNNLLFDIVEPAYKTNLFESKDTYLLSS